MQNNLIPVKHIFCTPLWTLAFIALEHRIAGSKKSPSTVLSNMSYVHFDTNIEITLASFSAAVV